MNFDLGAALTGALGGLGHGLIDVGQEQQRQQDRAETEAMNEKAWEGRQKWLKANGPPKTRTETIEDTANPGSNKMLNEHWEPASEGEPAQWLIDSKANDPNTMRINAKADSDAAKMDLANQKLVATGDINAQRMDLAREKLAAQQERGSSNGNISFQDYQNASPEQQALYDRYRRGGKDPEVTADQKAREQTLKDTTPLDKPGDRAKVLYENQVMMGADPFKSVKGGVAGGALSQIGSNPQAQNSPTQQNAPSVQDLMQQASAAVSKGAPRDQVEARLKQLMQQYGYNPQ